MQIVESNEFGVSRCTVLVEINFIPYPSVGDSDGVGDAIVGFGEAVNHIVIKVRELRLVKPVELGSVRW